MLRKKQDQDSNQGSQTLQPSVTHQVILLLETAWKHISITVPLLICRMKKNSIQRRVGLKNEFWPLMPPRSSQSRFYVKFLSSLKMISHVPLTLRSSSLKHPFVVFCLPEACSDHTADSLSALQMASLQWSLSSHDPFIGCSFLLFTFPQEQFLFHISTTALFTSMKFSLHRDRLSRLFQATKIIFKSRSYHHRY